jgi:hypothetical protein
MLSKEEILKKAYAKIEERQSSESEVVDPILLSAMDEYANQKANEFAEWLNKEGYQEYDYYGRWIAPQNNNNVYNTQQVYEMFITQ